MQQHQFNQRTTGYRPIPGDDLLNVRFFLDEDHKDQKASLEAGYAVFAPREMVHVTAPANKECDIIAPVDSPCTDPVNGGVMSYRDRFPEDYERWKAGQSAAVSGTPLKNMPLLSKTEVSMLNAQNVFSVEQLADLGGRPLANLGPNGRKLQQQAVAFLSTARDTAGAMKLATENADLRQWLEALEKLAAGGQAEAPHNSNPEPTEPEQIIGEETATETLRKEELKAAIAEKVGARPRGNPSIETLERMLKDASE